VEIHNWYQDPAFEEGLGYKVIEEEIVGSWGRGENMQQ
jgi:hypothetical protein